MRVLAVASLAVLALALAPGHAGAQVFGKTTNPRPSVDLGDPYVSPEFPPDNVIMSAYDLYASEMPVEMIGRFVDADGWTHVFFSVRDFRGNVSLEHPAETMVRKLDTDYWLFSTRALDWEPVILHRARVE